MNSNEAKQIFLQALPELSEPLKSAVEFTLANWHKLNREPRVSDVAINFFASLPALPSNNVDDVFAAKLNEMAKLLRDDPDVWLSLNDLPHEEWRDVVGYEGLYQVSNYGRVKSFHNNGVRTLNPSFADYPGYYVVNLTKNGKQQTQYVHILVAQAFIPNPENKSYVNHIDGDKLNNCLENLEWTTPTENSRHAWRNGLIKSRTGTKNLHSKLTPEQVRYIRVSYKPHDENFSMVALARKFNVSKSTIYLVLARRTYKDVV